MSGSKSEETESISEMLAWLHAERTHNKRNSAAVVAKGEKLLEAAGGIAKLPESELWTFLEQISFAALDTGNSSLANLCIQRLQDRFPRSPRVIVLQGLLLESQSKLQEAKELYTRTLQKDEHAVAVRKRLISLHLNHAPIPSSSPSNSELAMASIDANLSVAEGVRLLTDYLDTVYNDIEAWCQLVSVYEQLEMLPQAQSALEDLILLAPHDPFHLLRHAETTYTLEDYNLAYREFCRVLEMAGPMNQGGVGRRAAFGIQLCIEKIRATPRQISPSGTEPPEQMDEIEALVTKELLKAYSEGWTRKGDKVAGHAEEKAVKKSLAASEGRVRVY